MTNTCKFCGKSFKREKTLTVHLCEQKRRWLNRDEKYAKIATLAYQRFYELSFSGHNTPTYDELCESRYYLGFTKFGKYILSVKAVSPEEYIDFVIRNSIALDKWCTDSVYNRYIFELNKRETVERALERSMLYIIEWSKEKSEPVNVFFRKISRPRLIQAIKAGRVSPWIIFNCDSGMDFMADFSDAELEMVKDSLDPIFWTRKFDVRKDDVEFAQDVLSKAGF
jgi:hypothetical protein